MKPLLMGLALFGLAVEPSTVTPETTESFVRYALTQGGLLSLVIVIGWSYRRDFTKMLDNKTDQIKILTDLVAQAASANARTADALTTNAKAIEVQASAVQSMTQVVSRFEGLVAGRRGAASRADQ